MKEPVRSATRFTIVGTTGTGIQYGIYYLFLWLFHSMGWDTGIMVSVAFSIGFCIEMVTNYLLQCVYVFKREVSWKTAVEFLGARGINYVTQMAGLWFFVWLLKVCGVNEDTSASLGGAIAIVVAGIINYFVLRIFYRKKE